MAEKKNQLNELIPWMENIFKKAPHLPMNIQEVLVKIAPWLALIFGILGILGGIGAIGVSPIAFLGGVYASAFVLLSGFLALAASVLLLVAFQGLLKRHVKGWTLLFWAEVISAVASLLSLSVGAVIGIIIGFYLLFEIKGKYK